MKYLLVVLSACLLSTAALADESAKHNCKQPIIPIPQASDVVVKYFNKHVDQYKACMTKFIDEQTDIAKSSTDVSKANAAHEAAEAAIKESNDFIALLNERNEHTQTDDDDDKGKM